MLVQGCHVALLHIYSEPEYGSQLDSAAGRKKDVGLGLTSENGDQGLGGSFFRWNVLLTEKMFDSEDIQLFVIWVVIYGFEN